MTKPWTYQTTHPWLTFELRLDRAPSQLWFALGECRSKCEHLAGVPLRPETAAKLHRIYLAKGIRATTAIEGNSLTEEQVRQHLEGKLKLPPSRAYLKREIQNILDLYQETTREVCDERKLSVTVDLLRDINRKALRGLELADHVMPGEIPTQSIGVGGYRGAPRAECIHLLQRLVDWISGDWGSPGPGGSSLLDSVSAALLKAVIAHLYIAWIHPFGDGNGRTARMLEVRILLQAGVPAPAAQLLSNHYNQTRTRYYQELDRASKSGGEVMPFLLYALEGFRDGIREQIREVQRQQMDAAWENHVYEQFRDAQSPSAKRQRSLLLEISKHNSVAKSDAPQQSIPLVRMYASKSGRTIARDLAALVEMGLLEESEGRLRARREVLRAFLAKRLPATTE